MDTFRAYLISKRLRPATVESYCGVMLRYGRGELAMQGMSWGAWQTAHSALLQYAAFLGEEEGEPVRAFLSRLEEPQRTPRRAERILSPTEYAAIREEIENESEPVRSVLAVVYHTGLRVGDVLQIDRSAVKDAMTTGLLVLEVKGGTIREYAWKVVRDHIEPLLGLRWRRLYEVMKETPKSAYNQLYYRLRIVAERAGVPKKKIHPHLLRRTFAYYALDATGNMEDVRQLLGHTSIATTQRYVNSLNVERIEGLMGKIDEKRFGEKK